jgi:hypothetical protein
MSKLMDIDRRFSCGQISIALNLRNNVPIRAEIDNIADANQWWFVLVVRKIGISRTTASPDPIPSGTDLRDAFYLLLL